MSKEKPTATPETPYPPVISIKKWGVEAGLHFFNILQQQIDFKKKFRVVLEHDPEKPTVTLDFHYYNG